VSGSLRRAAKRVTELALRASVAPLLRRALRQRAVVFAYHDVVPDRWGGGGDRSLHLTIGDFRAQLDILQATHEIVPLRQLLRSASTARTRPRAAITFDDAYRGAVTVGLPELARRRLPSTVFVTPDFLDGAAFWWDELSSPTRGLDPATRAAALEALRGDDQAIRTWAADRHAPVWAAAPEARGAAIADLEVATRGSGVALGAHTWRHPNLVRVSNERLTQELRQPLAWLRERFPACTVPLLAYPYGSFDARVIRAAGAAGYEAAFAIDGGWVPAQIDKPFAIPRVNVPAGISANGFALRASGLFV
jgi:peptidoglycan/xylan/chitin deacetylase (PgdA/CDA1 family)